MAYRSDLNPFSVDDDEFVNSGAKYRSREVTAETRGGDRYGDFDEEPAPLSREQQLQQLKQQSMNRQLESTQRCMASIYDSEAVGIATAEDLVRQGEQLDNIETKVDKINADTRVSQRHLNGIKSIFGGLKNWWQGEPKPAEPTTTKRVRTGVLQDTLSAAQSDREAQPDSGQHPALRLRSDNAAGFYNDDLGVGARSGGGFSSREARQGSLGGGGQQGGNTQRSAEWNEYEAKLDQNLGTMSTGLAQLKLLAKGMNEEIETQNDQLDRIMPKVDRADTKIRDQNRQMNQILGKK